MPRYAVTPHKKPVAATPHNKRKLRRTPRNRTAISPQKLAVTPRNNHRNPANKIPALAPTTKTHIYPAKKIIIRLALRKKVELSRRAKQQLVTRGAKKAKINPSQQLARRANQQQLAHLRKQSTPQNATVCNSRHEIPVTQGNEQEKSTYFL